MNVNVSSLDAVSESVNLWASDDVARYICVSNVHMCMEVYDDARYMRVVNGADLTVPDGMPMVWAQKLLGASGGSQVRGTDLTLEVCANAERLGLSVGFYGASKETLKALERRLKQIFPALDLAYLESPPYRQVTEEEEERYIRQINDSGVDVLFVGLGCPKQEVWMGEHVSSLSCTMLGVGAAFDFIAGNKVDAPRWIQKVGLEWLFRFATEPRRLWRRYLNNNPRFIFLFIRQLLGTWYV